MAALSLLLAFFAVLAITEYARIRRYIRRIEMLDRAEMQKNQPVKP